MSNNDASFHDADVAESSNITSYQPLNHIGNSHANYSNDMDSSSNLRSEIKYAHSEESAFTPDTTRTPTPSKSSLLGKNSGRSKLSNEDIRLILYLLVLVRPFKYIGDRKTSQTRKWELIKQKYVAMRNTNASLKDTGIPTVRTLQRQLSSAIKNAKIKTGSQSIGSFETENSIIESINEKSTLDDLEIALLRLQELSKRVRLGKLSHSPTSDSFSINNTVENKEPVPQFNASSDTPAIDKNLIQNLEFPAVQFRSISTSDSYRALRESRDKIRKTLKSPLASSNSSIISLLASFLTRCDELDKARKEYNDNILKQADSIFQKHIENFHAAIEANNRLAEEQSELNRAVLIDFTNAVSKSKAAQVKNSVKDDVNMKALIELLGSGKI